MSRIGLLFLLSSLLTSWASAAPIGSYSDGSLTDAVALLQPAPGAPAEFHKLFVPRGKSFGSQSLVDAVVEIARAVREIASGSLILQVGDLSARHGGKITGHKSHQNGLDVDLVYLEKNLRLQSSHAPYWTEYFVSKDKVSSNLDIERNWKLFVWIRRNLDAERIFVDGSIKDKLCAYARAQGQLVTESQTLKMLVPENTVHKTHFHLRMKCPRNASRCISQPAPTQVGC